MFVDDGSAREALVRMVRRMTVNAALREDLLQEALIHLWLTETRRPGQTKSWYLQSCKYHLLHYLASGRSVDSAKRRGSQFEVSFDAEDKELFLEQGDHGDSVVGWVSARDIISLLTPQLLPRERAVLGCFADGMGPREIGRKLRMSHTMVIKHRRKIASLFHRLEVPAPPKVSLNGLLSSNGTSASNGNGHHVNGVIPVLQPKPEPNSKPDAKITSLVPFTAQRRLLQNGINGLGASRFSRRLAAAAR